MCFTFKKNNNWTKKPVNHFLQDGVVSANLYYSSNKSLPNAREWTIFLELKFKVHTSAISQYTCQIWLLRNSKVEAGFLLGAKQLPPLPPRTQEYHMEDRVNITVTEFQNTKQNPPIIYSKMTWNKSMSGRFS